MKLPRDWRLYWGSVYLATALTVGCVIRHSDWAATFFSAMAAGIALFGWHFDHARQARRIATLTELADRAHELILAYEGLIARSRGERTPPTPPTTEPSP
jgi:hypothetical protein